MVMAGLFNKNKVLKHTNFNSKEQLMQVAKNTILQWDVNQQHRVDNYALIKFETVTN